MVVQAGAVLQTVQEAARDAGWMFGVDFGARGGRVNRGGIAKGWAGEEVVAGGGSIGPEMTRPGGPALLAGGGMQTGQIIGATDRIAGTAVSRPVHYKDVFATLYKNLGLDARQITIDDPQGRPQYLLDDGEVIHEVV